MSSVTTFLTLQATTWRALHRVAGVLLAVFLLAHLANHLSALAGLAVHRQVLEALRTVYRFPPAEALLLACVAVQVFSGLRFALRGWGRRRYAFARAQAWSGLYLAFFLLVHVAAVLAGRAVFGLDTDFHFAAAGIHASPFAFFFVPYYWLAVVSAGIHIACAVRRFAGNWAAFGLAAAGGGAACLIVAALGGVFFPVLIPAPYLAIFKLG